MNRLEQEIYDFIIFKKLGYLRLGYLKLLDSSISGQSFKKLKELYKSNNIPAFENSMILLFEKYSISYQVKKYKYQDKTSSLRQKKYQNSLKEKGYKTLSFSVSPSIYKKFLSLKKSSMLTNNELFEKFLK